MENKVKYFSIATSLIAIVVLVLSGIKLASGRYDLLTEGIILGGCLVILLTIAIRKVIINSK